MILALDLGTKCGWAKTHPDRVLSGSLNLGATSIGERTLNFGDWLTGNLDGLLGVDCCYYEAPHAHSGASRDIIYGLQGVLLAECVRRGIDSHRVAANTLKKWATGDGRCGKLAMVERACQIAGRTITDLDEADAICLLGLALERSKAA